MEAPPSNLPPHPDSTWRLRGQRRTNIGVPDIDCVALLRGGHHCPLNVAFLLKQIPRSKQQYERKADIVSVFFIYLFFHFVIVTLPIPVPWCRVVLCAAGNI